MSQGALNGMVLCAGLGTRLRPLSDVLPKPACPVMNRPLVAYNLALLKAAGARTAVVNTHHLPAIMASVARAEADLLGLPLHVSEEPVLLGTGGGLAAARPWLAGSTFALLNGDFLFDVDLPRAIEAHRRAGAAATLVVQPLPDGYQPVHRTAAGLLACVPGDPPPPGATPWHFTGVHVLEPAVFEGLTAQPTGIFEAGYRHLLAQKLPVLLHEDRGTWRDIGAAAHYLSANLDAAAGRLSLDRYGALGRLAAVHPTARIEGSVTDSVVGAGAVVPAGASARDCVLLPNTALSQGEQLKRAIAAAGGLRIQL